MPEQTSTDERKTFLDLSMTQLVGSSLAAATAAFLGSRVGLVGTIVGAAVASVVSAVAGAAYTASLRHTHLLLKGRARISWGHIAAGAAVIFVITALVITGTELLTGRSFDGSKGTSVGRAVNGGSGKDQPAPSPTTKPTATPSGTASPSPVDPSASPSDQPTDQPTTSVSPSPTVTTPTTQP